MDKFTVKDLLTDRVKWTRRKLTDMAKEDHNELNTVADETSMLNDVIIMEALIHILGVLEK